MFLAQHVTRPFGQRLVNLFLCCPGELLWYSMTRFCEYCAKEQNDLRNRSLD